LTQAEEEEGKRGALMSQQSVQSKDKGGKGGKETKDKGKPAAKGQTPADDANVPKNIEIEYPEDLAEEPDFIIMEKNYMNTRQVDESVKKPATSSMSKDGPKTAGGQSTVSGAAGGTAGTEAEKAEKAKEALEQKKLQRQRELRQEYDIIRAKPYSMAVEVKLNVYPPPKPSEPTPNPSLANLPPPESKLTDKKNSKLAKKK